MRKVASLVAAASLLLGATQAVAQGWQSRTVPPVPPGTSQSKAAPGSTTAPAKPAAAKTAPVPPTQPLQAQVSYLVRTTVLALNDANRTGNYTLLRDLASPSFRERNSAADLAQVFAEMRRARMDLSMAAFLVPELDEQPSLDGERRLRLKGTFPTEPNRVGFDIVYEAVAGHWQVYGISIATRPARTAAGGPGH